MQLATAKAIVSAAEDAGFEDVRLYEDYSGRGMFGRTTPGIVIDRLNDLLPLVATVAAQWETYRQADADGRTMGIDEFINDLTAIKTDNLGRGLIVY